MEKLKYYFYLVLDNIVLFTERLLSKYPIKTKKNIYIIVITVVVLSLAFCTYLLFFRKNKTHIQTQSLIQVKVINIVKKDFTDKYTVMGSIKGAVENDMRFEIDGRIAVYNFREGDKIAKGENICSLDPKDAMTKVAYAKSKYKSDQSAYFSAREKYKVYEDLYKMKALSESKLSEAKFEIESNELRAKAAKSELDLAELTLKKTILLAPSDGILAEIIVKPGEYITQQDVVCKFISDQGTNFEVDIPEKDVKKMKVGQKVKIISDAYAEKEFDGQIAEIAPIVKERTRTSNVKINVINDDKLLRSGMFARGTIFIKELKDVIVVPTDSIISLNDTTFLIPVVVPDSTPFEGTVQMRPCIIGNKMGDKTVVMQGLNMDDLIVVETQGQLSDGIKVKFQIVEQEEDVPISEE
ncbi:MAG: efflux RND transporter periplasmic adaptor subunit [Endomicrobium sp.]|nr:efflux RND transporter periplasmic adaptor subunit [Endomicrobium sp.]